MTGAEVERCTNYACDRVATRTLSYPASLPSLPPFVRPYCEKHAEQILSEPSIWPGASEVQRTQTRKKK